MKPKEVDIFYGTAHADDDTWKVCVRIDDIITYGDSTYPDEATTRAVLRDLVLLNDVVAAALTGAHLMEVRGDG